MSLLKTEYFVSKIFALSNNGQYSAIEEARKKRNEFISSNESCISEIVGEKIDINPIPLESIGNSCIIVTITLSYYPNNK